DRLSLSIASCVASIDETYNRYASQRKVQKQISSDIVQLDSIIDKLLEVYRRNNGNLYPDCIIVFRDGVSEGQFDLKLLAVIKQKNINAKLTYAVVQKRHNTRFIPKDAVNATRSGNVSAGTVVDISITDPDYFDFFISSHCGNLVSLKCV
ncbi:hypothetical protein B4U80_11191, partial [Leptotrombidium deliense]